MGKKSGSIFEQTGTDIAFAFLSVIILTAVMYFVVLFVDESKIYLMEPAMDICKSGLGVWWLLHGIGKKQKIYMVLGTMTLFLSIWDIVSFISTLIA